MDTNTDTDTTITITLTDIRAAVAAYELRAMPWATTTPERAAIDNMLLHATWGAADHGRVFVSRRRGWPSNSNTYTTISVDGLPIVSGEIRWSREVQNDVVVDITIHDRAVAHARREEYRTEQRKLHADQALLRERIARELTAGRVPVVEATDGQRGGYLTVRTPSHLLPEGRPNGLTLAISGVLKAAGLAVGDHAYDTWTALMRELEFDQQYGDVGPRARARNLPLKVRRLRQVEARV